MPQFNALGPEPTWADVGMMPAPGAGYFPAANSVDWLQQRLPKPMGDWLGDAYTQGERRSNALNDPRQLAGEVISTAMNLMPMGRMAVPRPGIRAYHGSPYDFDRFDMNKIGSGEGAQSFGHGLYFSENPMVAKSYKQNLGRAIMVDDKPFLSHGRQVGTTGNNNVDMALMATNGDVDAAIGQYKSLMERGDPTARNRYSETMKALEDFRGRVAEGVTGKMYEVNINAKPEQFLDWDRPIGQQPEIIDKLRSNPLTAKAAAFDRAPGGQFYQSRQFMPDQYRPDASAALRDAGIPGIRYLDQGSRGQAGGGTSNYVLFNDSIIDILKKWGLAGMLGGGSVNALDNRNGS